VLFKAVLMLVFLLCALFAWRGRTAFPGMAALAAVLAGIAGLILFRTPALAALGLIAAGLLIYQSSRRR
jgi:hypothetical protein